MNGIVKITDRIIAEAQREANAMLAEADRKCDEIMSRNDELAQKEYWKLIRAGVKDTELRAKRLDSATKMEARKSILSLKQEMISRAFERASELLCSLPKDKYVAFLAKTAANASRTGVEEICFSERDGVIAEDVCSMTNVLLKANGQAKLTVSPVPRKIMGGFILKDGDVEVNCSVETLCDLCKNELTVQVAETMFTE